MEKFENKYLNIYGRYYKFMRLADGKLSSEDGSSFNVHRVLLVDKSQYFRSMFLGLNKDRTEFTVPGISGKCLAFILRYIYTGEIVVDVEYLSDLLKAASSLLITDIILNIQNKIKECLTISNCLQTLQVANEIGNKKITRETFRFVETNYSKIVLTQMNFIPKLSFEALEIILSSRSLYAYNESSVWDTIVQWIQKDTSTRLCFLLQLLRCLPRKELDEDLSHNILQHEIVSQDPVLKELKLKSPENNFNILSQFLDSGPNGVNFFCDSYGYRVPAHLHLIIPHKNCFQETKLFITYDENLDLWFKVTDIDFTPDFLEVVGNEIYLFDTETCKKFNLIFKDWERMDSFEFNVIYSVTHIDDRIYIAGNDDNSDIIIEVYDTINEKWFQLTSLPDIDYAAFVAFDRNIYVVGLSKSTDDTIMKVFNSVSEEWSDLSPPGGYVDDSILVIYHRKIYLIGESDEEEDKTSVEVFDPERNEWQNTTELPHFYSSPKAIVINDILIMYEDDENLKNSKNVCWNEANCKWKKLKQTSSLRDFHSHLFKTVDDVNIVRMLTKEMRDPEISLEESTFI